MDETREEEAQLAEGLRQGEPGALNDLVRRFLPGVVRQARSILGSTTEADDAAQEVFMKAIRGGPSFRGQRVRPWLASITHHHCLNRLQARQRHPEIPVEHLPETASHVGPTDNPGGLPDILQGLTGIEREVVLLRIVEEMEYEEIAQITSLAAGSLRNVLSRALHKLRQEVESPRRGESPAGRPSAGARDCNQGGVRVGQRQDGALGRRGAPRPEEPGGL